MENLTFLDHPNNTMDYSDIDGYLAAVLGPKRLPLNWLLPLTSVYTVIFCTGLVGNSCTCLVIARNPYMQTATNCYLFNLAVADMLTLICAMPLELYSLWHQYPWQLGSWMCVLRTVMAEATAYASILTIATFSCEQYIAVCHPLRQTGNSKVWRSFRNIAIIWIVSFAAAAPYGVFTRVNYLTMGHGGPPILQSAWCGFPFNDPNREWETLMLCSTFLFFVVPMTLISVIYVRIALTLHRTRVLHRNGTASDHVRSDGQRTRMQSRRIVIRMLMTVVVAFFVCWAPYHSQRLLFLYVSLYGEWTEALRKVNQDLFSLAGCFYYFNSTINPILYNVMSNRFRVAFREKLCAGNPCTCLLCGCCCCWQWWRDECCHGRRVSSCGASSSSHPDRHASDAKSEGDKLANGRPRSFGGGSSEGKRLGDRERVHYNSDPNFSFRLQVSRCHKDYYSATDGDSDFQLAMDLASGNEEECISCTNCNNMFVAKPRVSAMCKAQHPITKTSTVVDFRMISAIQESTM